MTDKPSTAQWIARTLIVVLVLAVAGGVAWAAEDATFTTVEKEGSKVWDGGGMVALKGRTTPLTLKVTNTLTAEHGFAIDTMKVKEVIKAGETKTISVPLADIDMTAAEHRVYCQLHPKHGAASLKVTK
jgi:nitrosocyanin